MRHGDIQGGSHLGTVRNWIKWHFCFGNGETVTWGTHEVLHGRDVHVDDLERLAQDICDAVLDEYAVKPKDHEYKYVVFSSEGCAAFQNVDTAQEAWNALFKAEGEVAIYERSPNGELGKEMNRGKAEEVREWLRRNNLP